MSPGVLPNLIAAGLVAGLALFVTLRRPPSALWPVLLLYQLFTLVYIVGDGITLLAGDMRTQQIGDALLYSGGLFAAAACWVLAVRYAEAERRPFVWARGPWIRAPIALAYVSWLAMLSNPWHGQFWTPVIGAPNEHHWLWYALLPGAYACAGGSVFLYMALAWRTPDVRVRRNAAILAGGILLNLGFHSVSYVGPLRPPFDLTVVGLGATNMLFLYGAYRTRLFSLLPIALREIIRHDRDGVVLVDPHGRWLHSNPAASALLHEEISTPDLDVLAVLARRLRSAEGRGMSREELLRCLLPYRAGARVELDPVRVDGERWLRVSATAIPSRSGRLVAVALRLQDVSEAQEAEASLRRARDELEQRVAERTAELVSAIAKLRDEAHVRQRVEQELRKSEERYRAVSELSSDLSFAFRLDADSALTWEWLPRKVTRLTGYGDDEIDDLDWRSLVHPDDLALVLRHFPPPPQAERIGFEFRIVTKQGEVRWLEMRVLGVRDATDGALRVTGAVRDITRRKKAEEERRKLEIRVQRAQRLESLGVLAGGIAHDFNNLLTVIAGNTALALAELGAPETLQWRLERIRSAAEYAAKLTDQILTYAGKSTLSVSPLDLGRLVVEMLDLLRASISPKCRVETELQDDLPAIEGDATQIQQVIMNLVTNASEAIGEAGGRIVLRTGSMLADRAYMSDAYGTAHPEPGNYVFVEVSDSGPGIDADTRARIFEPFFSKKFSGRGLGLAAVHGIVQAHRGAIKLTSAPGRGCVFRVLFPRSSKLVPRPSPAPKGIAPARPG